jgi:hypothetical protein
MPRKKSPDFFSAFAELPEEHKASMVVAMQMLYAAMTVFMGSVTFSKKEIELNPLFDDVNMMDVNKMLDFAKAMSRYVYPR